MDRAITDAALVVARLALEKAQKDFSNAVQHHFPIDAIVDYRRASHLAWTKAQVIMHGMDGDVRIRTIHTKVTAWVRAAYAEQIRR